SFLGNSFQLAKFRASGDLFDLAVFLFRPFGKDGAHLRFGLLVIRVFQHDGTRTCPFGGLFEEASSTKPETASSIYSASSRLDGVVDQVNPGLCAKNS